MEKAYKKSIRKLLAVSLIFVLVLLCMAGCRKPQNTPVSMAAEVEFRKQMMDSSVQEITLSGDLVLTSPVEVTGSKKLQGTGNVTAAVQNMDGEYLFALASGAELTVGGDVVIDASGMIGGIYVGKDASCILQDNAVVKNASKKTANICVEGVFRMNGGALTDAQGHNLYNKNETVIAGGQITGSGEKFAGIYNAGKLTQEGGTVSGAYHNIVVADDGVFDWKSGVNQSSIRDGIVVNAGGKLNVCSKDAQLMESGARGIYISGEAVIDGITVKKSADTQIMVASGATLQLNGGIISDGGYHGVSNAGTMYMTGGDIFSNDDSGVVNTGTLEITGGGIMSNGEKGIVNKNKGQAKVVSDDVIISANRVAIGNEDDAYFELSSASILQSTNANIYAYDGEMYIHDIELGASASNNVRVVNAEVTLKNVEVMGNTNAGTVSTHGILMEGGSVHGENVIISNTTGCAIRNKGGHLEGTNFTFKNIGQIAINLLDQDVTGRAGSIVLNGVTTEDAGHMNVLNGGSGTIELSNAVLCATPSNNVRTNSGTLKLTNIQIQGHNKKANTSHHGIYLEGGQIIATNVSISNTKGHGIRNKGGAFIGHGITIQNVNGDAGISNTILADGSTGPITLYNLSISNVASKNVLNEGGTTYIYNSTLAPTPGSNVKITGGGVVLDNVHVQGSSEKAEGSIHAVIIENGFGTLTANNVIISGAKNSAIRNKTGIVTATNLTLQDCGAAAISNGDPANTTLDGETTVNGLTVLRCNSGITVDTGKVTVTNAVIGAAKTNNIRVNGGILHLEDVEVQGNVEGSATNVHGIYVPGGVLTAADLSVNNTSGAAIRVAGGNVTAEDVTLANIGQAGISSTGGITQITGLKTSNISTNTVYAVGTVSEDGKTVEAVVKITDGDLCKVTNAHNVKAGLYGTVELNKVKINGAAMTDETRYGLITEGGTIKMNDVAITGIDYSAIHANKDTSIVEGTNVTVDGAAYAITGGNGKITINKLTTSNIVRTNVDSYGAAVTLSNSTLGRTTSDSTDNVTGHSVKSTGTAVVTLNKVEILGTTEAAHAVLAEGGDIVMNDVKILNAGNTAIRVNKEASTVTGKNVVIDTVRSDAISVNNGAVEIDGLTTKSVGAANIAVGSYDAKTNEPTSGGSVKITNADLCKPAGDAHSVKSEGTAVVELDTVTINGTSSDSKYAVIAQGGEVKLSDVTIKDCAKSAIHANKDTSIVTGRNVVIQDAAYGITGSTGEIIVDTLVTSNVIYQNVDSYGVDVTLSNATIGKTTSDSADNITGHSIRTTAGTVTLTNVDILGTTEVAHAILAEGGNVVLTDVNITDAGNTGIRINRDSSSVTGENISIQNAVEGISASNGSVKLEKVTIDKTSSNAITATTGSVEINGLKTTNIAAGNLLAGSNKDDASTSNKDDHEIADLGGSIKITNGNLCKPASGHSVRSYGNATVELIETVIEGINGSSYCILAQHGDVVLTDVTISGGAEGKAAVWVNKPSSEITGTRVTVQNADWGIGGSNGVINIDGLTANATGRNISAEGANITLNNAVLGSTATHNIKVVGGALTFTGTTAINGTTGDWQHGILMESGNCTVSATGTLSITGCTGRALHIKQGNFTAETVNVSDAASAVNVENGDSVVKITNGAVFTDVGESIRLTAGQLTIHNADLGATTTHNVVVEGGTLAFTGTTAIKGTSDDSQHGIILQNGNGTVNATGTLSITNCTGNALNILQGDFTAETVNVSDAAYAVVVENADSEVKITNGAVFTGVNRSIHLTTGKLTIHNADFGPTASNNVKVVNGALTFTGTTTIGGTTGGWQHGIIMEQGSGTATIDVTGTLNVSSCTGHAIYLNPGNFTAQTVNISNCTGNALNILQGDFTAETVNISGANRAVNVENADSEVKITNGGTFTNVGRSIQLTKGQVEITGVTLSKNKDSHNIKVEAGKLTLTNVDIAGSPSRGIMIEPNVTGVYPEVTLNNVTIGTDTEKTASNAVENRGSKLTATDLVIKNAGGVGIYNLVHNVDKDVYGTAILKNVQISGSVSYGIRNDGTMTLNGGHIYATTGYEIMNTGDLSVSDILLGYGDGDTNGGILYNEAADPVKFTGALRHTQEQGLTIAVPDGKWVLGANLVECQDEAAAKAAVVGIKQPDSAPYVSAMGKYLQLTTRKGGNFLVEVTDGENVLAGFQTLDAAVDFIVNSMDGNGEIVVVESLTQSTAVMIPAGANITIRDEGAKSGAYVITSSVTNGDLFTVSSGASLTVTASDTSGLNIGGQSANAIFYVTGGTLTVNNVDVTSASARVLQTTSAGGTVNINGGSFSNAWRNAEVAGGTVTMSNVTMGKTSGHNIKVSGGTLNLAGTTTINGTASGWVHGIIMENGNGTINATGTLNITNCSGHAFNIKKGSFTAETVNTSNVADAFSVSEGAEVKITKGGTVSDAISNSGTMVINGGTFSGKVTNTGELTINGGTFTGGVVNSGTASLSNASFSGGADGNAISTTGALTISGITVDGKLYVAASVVPVTYNGDTSKHTAEDPLIIVTDEAALVGGTKLIKCDSDDAASKVAGTFKVQDANGNLIPLVAQGDHLALAAARYNGVAYASIEDAMAAARTAYPSITNDNRLAVYGNPIELLSNVVLSSDLTVRYPLAVPAGYKLTLKDDGTTRQLIRSADFTQMGTFIQVKSGAELTVTSTSLSDETPKLIFNGEITADGNRENDVSYSTSSFVVIHKGGVMTMNAGVKMMNNVARGGGAAIQNNGTLTVNGGVFENNMVHHDGGNAGAISAGSDSQATTIANATFTNNTSKGKGGAIAVDGGTVSISNTVFKKNSTTNYGGAVFVAANQTVTFTGCTFEENKVTVNTGGAINGSNNATLNISGCTFKKNSAITSGGAIDAGNGVKLTIENGTVFEENTAKNSGGAICVASNCKTVTISNVAFRNNTSQGKGGAISVNGGTVNISNTEFKKNSTTNYGGAVFVAQNQIVTFTGCTFEENKVTAKTGGAINGSNNATLNISGCTFKKNSAEQSGGAIDAGNGVKLTIENGTVFEENTAKNSGGAIIAKEGATVTITGGSFIGNTNTVNSGSNGGGAIYMEKSALTANRVLFAGNSAVPNGGAISVKHGTASAAINACTFESNSATVNGGAIYVGTGCSATVDSATTYGTDDKKNTVNGTENNIYKEGQ